MLQAQSSATRVRPIQNLGPYLLLGRLGQGRSADVYLAEDRDLHVRRAVKVLKDYDNHEMRRLLHREAQLLARLEHPNIIDIKDYDFHGTIPYFAMTLAKKGSLQQQHPLGQRLPMALILRYLRQLASATDYLHSNGFLHMDLKPGNILLRHDNRLQLCDFHIATTFPYRRTSGGLIGTLPYMAPERFSCSSQVSSASDLYSIGAIVYQWISGVVPFYGLSLRQHLELEAPPLRQIRPTIPLEVEQVVLRALEKDPERRFSSVHEFELSLTLAWKNSHFPQKSRSVYPLRQLIKS